MSIPVRVSGVEKRREPVAAQRDGDRRSRRAVVGWQLLMMMAVAAAAGCSDAVPYRITLAEPWKNEPAPSEPAAERVIDLPRETINWHKRVGTDERERLVRQQLAAFTSLAVDVRHRFIEPDGSGKPLMITEVLVSQPLLPQAVVLPPRSAAVGTVDWLSFAHRAGLTVTDDAGYTGEIMVAADVEATAAAAMRYLIERDLVLSCTQYMPVAVRSFEYADSDEFLRVAVDTAKYLSEHESQPPFRVVTIDEWFNIRRRLRDTMMAGMNRDYRSKRSSKGWRDGPPPPSPLYLPPSRSEVRRILTAAIGEYGSAVEVGS